MEKLALPSSLYVAPMQTGRLWFKYRLAQASRRRVYGGLQIGRQVQAECGLDHQPDETTCESVEDTSAPLLVREYMKRIRVQRKTSDDFIWSQEEEMLFETLLERKSKLVEDLTWKDVLQLCWEVCTCSHRYKDSKLGGEMLGLIESMVEEKLLAGNGKETTKVDMLQGKAHVSLIRACSQMDGGSNLVSLILQHMPIDVKSLDSLSFISFVTAVSNVKIEVEGLHFVLSQRIEQGLLDDVGMKRLGPFFRSLSLTKWIPSDGARELMMEKVLWMKRCLNRQDIVSIVRILFKPRYIRPQDVQRISGLIQEKLDLCSVTDLGSIAKSCAMVHIVNATPETEMLLEQIALRATFCLDGDGADPKDIVRLIQPYQEAGIRPESLLEVLDLWADKRLASMNVQGISFAMKYFARIGEASSRLLKTASEMVGNKIDEITAPDASRLMWAFARLEFQPEDPLVEKAMYFLINSDALSDMEVANLMWALVKLDRVPSTMEQIRIASALYRSPGSMSGQSAALLLWSFASSQHINDEMVRSKTFHSTMYRLGMEVTRDILAVDSQTVSLTAWSLGVMKIRHQEFEGSLSQLSNAGMLHRFEPQHIANLLWGLAKAEMKPPDDVLEGTVEILTGNFSSYDPQEIFNICWSFATMRYSPPLIGKQAAFELKLRSNEFDGLEFAGMIWSLSRLLDPPKNMESMHNLEDLLQAAVTVLSVVEKELPKHINHLESTQFAMATLGLGRLSMLAEKPISSNLASILSSRFAEVIVGHDPMSIASLNATLEGMKRMNLLIPEGHSPAFLRLISARHLSNAMLWELCDLAFNLSEARLITPARTVLNFIDRVAIEKERLTPRGAIMLLCIMHACNEFPENIVCRATTKLNTLSPKYQLNEKWITRLSEVRILLPGKIQVMLTMHEDWEQQIFNLFP